MKILQICSKPPLPSLDGGCKASHNFTQGFLDANVEVKILTLSTHKHPFQIEKLPKTYVEKTNIESVYVDTSVKLIPALLNLYKSVSYNVSRFYSEEFERLIVETIKKDKFEAILFEGLYVAMYVDVVKLNTTAKLIYRAHNVEHEIWERNAEFEDNYLKKKYYALLAKQLKDFETKVLNKFTLIAAITEKDKNVLSGYNPNIPIEVFPFGIDLQDYIYNEIEQKNTVFHIGSMDWLPNIKGIEWFLNDVWKNAQNVEKNSEFVLAGKKMPKWLLDLKQPCVRVVGEVDDALDFISQYNIMVVPLFSGSGMRIKIIEAMALGKMVVATSVALEGIKCENGINVIIANNKEEFVSALEKCFKNKLMVEQVSKNARLLVEENYNNILIIRNLLSFIQTN